MFLHRGALILPPPSLSPRPWQVRIGDLCHSASSWRTCKVTREPPAHRRGLTPLSFPSPSCTLSLTSANQAGGCDDGEKDAVVPHGSESHGCRCYSPLVSSSWYSSSLEKWEWHEPGGSLSDCAFQPRCVECVCVHARVTVRERECVSAVCDSRSLSCTPTLCLTECSNTEAWSVVLGYFTL